MRSEDYSSSAQAPDPPPAGAGVLASRPTGPRGLGSVASPRHAGMGGVAVAGVPADGGGGGGGGVNLLQICWRRKGIVIGCFVACVGVAMAYLQVATRLYTSQARLLVEVDGPRLLGSEVAAGQDRVDAYLSRQAEIIRSDNVLRRAAADCDAGSMQTFAGREGGVVNALKERVNVSVGKKDEIVNVSMTSAFPDEAAELVNSVVAAYIRYQKDQTRQEANGALDVLRGEAGRQEAALADKRAEIVAFKRAHGEMFFATANGTNVLTQNMATIGARLTDARLNVTAMRAARDSATNISVAALDLRRAEQEAAEFERQYDREKEKALQINADQATFERLTEEAERTTRLLDALDGRTKELAVTERGGGMNVRELEPAKVETKASSPNKRATALAAGMLGLMLGCGLATLREWGDGRIRTAEEAARQLGLPVLGVIPSTTGRGVVRGAAGEGVAGEEAAEAYRMLRTVVYFSSAPGTAKSLLITSPERLDGKSTTCANLAAAMAQSGRRTLLVDADLRKPVQHEAFDVPGEVGLSDVVARGVRLENAIQRTAVEDLSVLPAGTLPPNPAEVLNSVAFNELLRRLETNFDFVIIDSPPLLAVSDGQILGAQADWTILVVRAGRSKRREARQATARLARVGSSLLGVVLNGARKDRHAGYYYGPSPADGGGSGGGGGEGGGGSTLVRVQSAGGNG